MDMYGILSFMNWLILCGKLVGKYTNRPMDAMGWDNLCFQHQQFRFIRMDMSLIWLERNTKFRGTEIA